MYNYMYEDGRLTYACESDVQFSEYNYVTRKTPLYVVRYFYDTEGNLATKRTVFADGKEQTVTYETAQNETQLVKTAIGEHSFVSVAKTDSFGRKEFDEIGLSKCSVTRKFDYLKGQATEEHIENGKYKSVPTTQLVSKMTFQDGRTIEYEYDKEERITKITDSLDGVTEYTYDALGQLLTEVKNGEVINQMTYDNYGNIVTKNGIGYVYNDKWKDRLDFYDGKAITYDEQGNPESYRDHWLIWEKGRQLKFFDDIRYTYNANGSRTSKTVDNVRHDFCLDGAKILRETWNGNTIEPIYDQEDSVCGIIYNQTPYYFIKNLQGDVIAITDSQGKEVARYSYDAWGKCEIDKAYGSSLIAHINPFRYRSYYYDIETGLYYLQSRYYDAETGRFLNGDEVIYTFISKDASGYNTFEYCNNDCINLKDKTGHAYVIDDALAICVGAVIIAVVIVLIAWLISFFSSNEFKKEWSKSRTMTSSTFISGLILIYAGVAIRNWFQKLKTNIKKEILKFIATQIYLNSTIALATVKPLLTQSKVYRVAYAVGKQLVQVGKWLTFVEALSVLGIKKAAYSLSRRYSVKIKKRPANCLTKNWGMYTKKQSYACALAIVLGCNSDPEVHGSGYYGHYHDKKHVIHIWYGEPIGYQR